MRFEEFFEQATGSPPYGYQVRLARDGLPPVLAVPTGAGKTAIILAWLWRRRHGPASAATPRRLVFALPQRTLVEQVAAVAGGWLASLGLTDDIPLHVVMGGAGKTQRAWRVAMHQPAIVVGTVDSLVSKALNRGYGVARAIYPIDFALVTNGAYWVLDELQLCPESMTTLRQLAAFTNALGTAEPFGLTCMSATVPERLLETVDNPAPDDREVVQIEPGDRAGELAVRLAATRTVRRLPAEPGDHRAIADAVRARHRPGTLTLVVVNTVDAARQVHRALPERPVPRLLLHSRFRGVEREELVRQLMAPPGEVGRIVVATQVVEAGLDLDAAVLVTEAAPWPSVVQRAGRCNRAGTTADAELWWLPPAGPAPYERSDVDAAATELAVLAGASHTGEELAARPVTTTDPEVSVIRRTDLLTLFDTAPDLTGSDLDIAPYVRDTEDLDVQLGWAHWRPAADDGRPPDEAKAPEPAWRCRVPLGELRVLLKRGAAVWRFDQALGRWTRVGPPRPARPGEVLVMAARDGGYHLETGFDPAARAAVPDCPTLGEAPDPPAGTEDAYRQDDTSVDQSTWVPLDQHSEEARDQADALLRTLAPALPAGVAAAVVRAAYAHDAGKCHHAWQRALCDLAPEREREDWFARQPWAKSAVSGRLRFRGGGSFRHELVSLLLLDGPLAGLLDGIEDPDLVRYLVLAHHGKLRVQVRGPEDEEEKVLLGLEQEAVIESPALLRQPAGRLTVDLDQFRFGGERSWTRTALRLRDRYGPFLLAYLETLVRVADWRASAREELPR
jgi:CRISPR-associated endonuclease/helicase Cas3